MARVRVTGRVHVTETGGKELAGGRGRRGHDCSCWIPIFLMVEDVRVFLQGRWRHGGGGNRNDDKYIPTSYSSSGSRLFHEWCGMFF